MTLLKPSSIIGFFLTTVGLAQTYPPPTTLVTVPSAGTLVRGSYAMQMRIQKEGGLTSSCLLYTSPSPRDYAASRMPSSA